MHNTDKNVRQIPDMSADFHSNISKNSYRIRHQTLQFLPTSVRIRIEWENNCSLGNASEKVD